MKAFTTLTILSLAQAKMFRRATAVKDVHFLGSGDDHTNELFHAVISAPDMDAVKALTVSYYNCGTSVCSTESGVIATAVSVDPDQIPGIEVTDTGEADGGNTIFDVKYTYSGDSLVNHLLTVFSDGLGEESIICGVNKKIKEVSDAPDTCAPCGAGATAGVYDITCTNNVCTCSGGTATVYDGTGGTLCDTDGQIDCSACNPGYGLNIAAAEGTASTCGLCATCGSGKSISTPADGTCGTCTCVITSCGDGETFNAGIGDGCGTCSCTISGDSDCATGEKYTAGDGGACGTCGACDACDGEGKGYTGQSAGVCGTCECTISDDSNCASGEKYTAGVGGACGTCVEKPKMFGWVIVREQECEAVCAGWHDKLEEGFDQGNIEVLDDDTNAICALLKNNGPMIRSSVASGCPHTI